MRLTVKKIRVGRHHRPPALARTRSVSAASSARRKMGSPTPSWRLEIEAGRRLGGSEKPRPPRADSDRRARDARPAGTEPDEAEHGALLHAGVEIVGGGLVAGTRAPFARRCLCVM